MTINLSDNSPRVSYNVAAGVSQSAFVVSFEFFDNDDLNVYVDGTLKTITTDYTVTGGDGSTGTVTFVSAVVGASGGSTVVITRDIDLDRTTDFPSSGPFNIASLNTELDRFVAIAADLKDQADRALQLTDFDAAASLTLPAVDDRKGTVLAFNSTTGAVEAGPTTSNVNSLADITDDIATLADIEDGTDATDAIQTVAGISSNVSTVAGISGNVTTVAGISANVTAVAGDEADIGTVAGSISNVNTVATNIADVNTAATNITDIQNASTNATTATTKASEAATSATNAATSETNAATSATNAATSATAAATSQAAAAASAASAATAYDSFDDRYLGTKSSDPTVDNDGNALVSGALYFSSTSNTMQVYDGASWIAATSAGNVSYLLYEYTATSGQTTFSGSDDNSATLSYTVNNLQVVMNGVILDPSDYTATSGTSVVLGSGASTGDLVNIYAFKSFTTADMVPASTGGTFSGDVEFAADVGIGTSSPDRPLHVTRSDGTGTVVKVGNTGTSAATIEFSDTGTTDTVSIGSVGNDLTLKSDDGDISLNTTGDPATASLYVERGGDIGIGTTSPSHKLHVKGVSKIGDAVSQADPSATDIASSSHAILGGQGGNAIYVGQYDNTHGSAHASWMQSSFNVPNTAKYDLVLQPLGGDVGIGEDTPTATLHVNKGSDANSAFPSGDWAAKIFNQTDLSTEGGMVVANRYAAASSTAFLVGGLFDSSDGFDDFFKVNGIGKATFEKDVTFNANVYVENSSSFVRTTGLGGNVGSAKFQVSNPDSSGHGAAFHTQSSSGFAAATFSRNANNGAVCEFFYNRSNSAIGSITVTSTATAYNTSSDYRLKENVETLSGAITRVKQLQPKRFSWIVDDEDSATVDGFLAHEAQTVVPEAVTGTHNEVDDDGNAIMQAIDQSKLVPLLTAALQEAIAKIETLETKVAALEANT